MTGEHAQVSLTRQKVWDLLERVAWTFAQAFVGALAVSNAAGVASWTELRDVAFSAALAGAAAVLALVKVLVAQHFGGGTGATLPAALEYRDRAA